MINRHFCTFDAYTIFIHSINIYFVTFVSLNERFFPLFSRANIAYYNQILRKKDKKYKKL